MPVLKEKQTRNRKKLGVWLQSTGIRSRGNKHVHPLAMKKPKLESISATLGQGSGIVIQKIV